MGSIELHAPTNTTQKLKLMGIGGKFTYTSTGRSLKPTPFFAKKKDGSLPVYGYTKASRMR